jgi:uncharacterized membrane protein YraQ (UPF0718 family)
MINKISSRSLIFIIATLVIIIIIGIWFFYKNTETIQKLDKANSSLKLDLETIRKSNAESDSLKKANPAGQDNPTKTDQQETKPAPKPKRDPKNQDASANDGPPSNLIYRY